MENNTKTPISKEVSVHTVRNHGCGGLVETAPCECGETLIATCLVCHQMLTARGSSLTPCPCIAPLLR